MPATNRPPRPSYQRAVDWIADNDEPTVMDADVMESRTRGHPCAHSKRTTMTVQQLRDALKGLWATDTVRFEAGCVVVYDRHGTRKKEIVAVPT
jgi:hypothetical protein